MVSFDVFDTLITRNVATPEGIFAIMQEIILNDSSFASMDIYTKNNFCEIRANSEILARHIFAREEVQEITIDQIYQIVALNSDFSEETLSDLSTLEKKVEIDNVVAISKNINLLKDHISKGEKTVLISDMYLDIDTIRRMLVKADEIFADIPIYLSSEYKKSKWCKSLYPIIKEIENISDYSDWMHYGDNYFVDVQNAKSFGINAIHLPFEQLHECEKYVLMGKDNNASVQMHIGVSRNTRVLNTLTKPMMIGSTVGGNILFPYVFWIINESIKKKISRLYFIARDGYILKMIADKIIEKEKYPITTHYIYGSRRAWRMASFSGEVKEIRDLIKVSYIERAHNLNDIAELFHVSLNEISDFLPGVDNYKDKKLTYNFVIRILELLSDNKKFAYFIKEKQFENRMLMRKYLQQEINCSDENFAFVELAGTGYTQMCLANVLGDFYKGVVKTYFFKMENIIVHESCKNYVYFPSLLNLDLILEMITRAPHGQTIGYKEKDGRIEPVFDYLEDVYLLNHGYNDYIEGIMKYTDTMISSYLFRNLKEFSRLNILVSIMKYIANCPDKDVLDFFADMPNSLTGREKEIILFAPKLTRRDIKNIFFLCYNEPNTNYYKGSSLEFSLLRCSKKELKLIDFYKRHYNSLYGKYIHYLHKKMKSLEDHYLYELDDYGLIQKNVIIYAAGKRGQLLYNQLSESHNYNIVMWVDKNYRNYREQGLPVCSPNDIISIQFDQVVIGVLDKNISEEIKIELIKIGVDRDKIIWIKPRNISCKL